MTEEKIIEFYRLLANGVPLTNVLWGKGKGYLQTMAKATLDLISQEQSRRAERPTGTISDAKEMMHEISKIVDQYTELQNERRAVTDETQEELKILDSMERDIRESDKLYIHISSLRGIINRPVRAVQPKEESMCDRCFLYKKALLNGTIAKTQKEET